MSHRGVMYAALHRSRFVANSGKDSSLYSFYAQSSRPLNSLGRDAPGAPRPQSRRPLLNARNGFFATAWPLSNANPSPPAPARADGATFARAQLARRPDTVICAARAEGANRRGGREAEGARLESVYAGNRIAGSNPAPSANSTPWPAALSDSHPRYDALFATGASMIQKIKIIYKITWPNGKIYVGSDLTELDYLLWQPG